MDGVGGLGLKGLDALFLEHSVQVGTHRAITVRGGGVVQGHLQGVGLQEAALEDAHGICAGIHHKAVFFLTGKIMVGEEFQDILPEELYKMGGGGVRLGGFCDGKQVLVLEHLHQEHNVDDHQTEVHGGGGIGLDEHRIDGENNGADAVDDAKLHHGGHEKRDQHQ